MRFLLRNIIRDPQFNRRRLKHPSKVCRRPVIGRMALPPNGTRLLRQHDFTPEIFEQICNHVTWGNVQLLNQNRGGGEANLEELAKLLGYEWPVGDAEKVSISEEPESPKPPEHAEKGEEGTVRGRTEIAAYLDETNFASPPEVSEPEGNDTPAAVLPDGESTSSTVSSDALSTGDEPSPLDEILESQPESSPEPPQPKVAYTKGELESLKRDDLKVIYLAEVERGSVGRKKNSDLIEEILEAQAEEG